MVYSINDPNHPRPTVPPVFHGTPAAVSAARSSLREAMDWCRQMASAAAVAAWTR